ncbi:MAG: hypothetical protein A2044_02790 [Candidatus Firestonebacteria bacterium GWA2_43_8]|nr:MAG: hypothetical protein A2044_02790 [Candidatus Firestonebacteria bacterium GWA2_43_8]
MKKVETGIYELNKMLFGGLNKGSSTLVCGDSGSGKTIFGLQFLSAGCARKEKCVLVLISSNEGKTIKNASKLNLNTKNYIEKGLLKVISLDRIEHIFSKNVLDEIKVAQRVVLDAVISVADEKIPPALFKLFDQMPEMTSFIISNEKHEKELAYFADNIIIMKLVEIEGKVNKALLIKKIRGGKFDNNIYMYKVDENGIEIQEPLGRESNILNEKTKKIPVAILVGTLARESIMYYENIVNKFRKLNPYIDISIFSSSPDNFETLERSSGISSLPMYLLPEMNRKDMLQDLNDIVNPNLVKQFSERLISSCYSGNKLYALPKNIEIGLIFYRKDLLRKYNRTVPQNWEDIRNCASYIAEKEKIKGIAYPQAAARVSSLGLTFLEYLWANGGEVYDKKGDIIIDNENGLATLKYIYSLFNKDNIAFFENKNDTEAFLTGNSVFLHFSSDLFYALETKKNILKGIENNIGFMNIPKGPLGTGAVSYLDGKAFVVSKKTGNKKTMGDVVNYLTEYENVKETILQIPSYPFPPHGGFYSGKPIRAYYIDLLKLSEKGRWLSELRHPLETISILGEEVSGCIVDKNADFNGVMAKVTARLEKVGERKYYGRITAKAMDFSRDNIASNLSTALIASKTAKLSVSHFSRIFKKITGSTYNDYLKKIRIEKAAELLVQDIHKNIKEIANEVGYHDLRYFSKLFKKEKGSLPTKFRKM